jgi:uncharacterized membrane protein YesL
MKTTEEKILESTLRTENYTMKIERNIGLLTLIWGWFALIGGIIYGISYFA